jgi:bacteriorhodopsin
VSSAGFAFTVAATVVFTFLSYVRNVRPEARLTYYLVTIINAIAALAFLTQALNGTQLTGHNSVRSFEWIRYAAWALQAPLTVFILGLLSGAHWVDQIWVSFATIIGVAAGFAAAVSGGYNATWPLFTFGVATFVPVFIALAYTFRRAAYKVHPEIGKLYSFLGFATLLTSIAYAITWGVSEGGYITTVDQELVM